MNWWRSQLSENSQKTAASGSHASRVGISLGKPVYVTPNVPIGAVMLTDIEFRPTASAVLAHTYH